VLAFSGLVSWFPLFLLFKRKKKKKRRGEERGERREAFF
jgi:hypothetical protein